MKNKTDWKYIHEYRRYKGNVYQLYKEGKWITINLSSDKPPNSNAPH